ncbi:MAG TPA: hypothetical protein VKD90_27580 [Gemmataceae bacterium]|nr:hypothetical protein [Gemmataceae bacterium]
MRKLFLSSALVAGMILMGQASAQFDPAMGKVFGAYFQVMQRNPAGLVMVPGVQKELKMDEEQVKTAQEKIGARAGFGFGKGKGGGGGDFKERMAKMMEKLEPLKDTPEDQLEDKIREAFKEDLEGPMKDLEKILKPEQTKRLLQISRQNAGVSYLASTDGIKELELKDEQKTKVKEIYKELQKDVDELRRSGGGKGGFGLSPESREKMLSLNKEAKEKALDALTKEQKEKYKELTGEPFEVKFEFRRPKKDD